MEEADWKKLIEEKLAASSFPMSESEDLGDVVEEMMKAVADSSPSYPPFGWNHISRHPGQRSKGACAAVLEGVSVEPCAQTERES